jgi:hypothetical protein
VAELSEVFVVETSFRVPGLGVLALPSAPAPAWLAAYPLHTALAISLLADTLPPTTLTGTVEEVAHDGHIPRRALLLDFDPGGPLAVGTRLQASSEVLPELL